MKSLSVQLSDLLVYLLIPGIALLLPARASRALLLRLAAWDWLLAHDAEDCCARAADYTAIEQPQEWKRRWRLVVMLEARDLVLLTWGRRRSVFAEIEGAEEVAATRDSVLVGMHWGPSIAILSLLNHHGLEPLLVYRPVEREIRRVRPFYHGFLVRSVRYIRKTCGSRAITIRGAGARLREELARPGTSVVVLDAPPAPGRSTIDGTVLGRPVRFNAGFPGILSESGRPYFNYAISLQPGDSGLRRLDLEGPASVQSEEAFMAGYCDFLDRHIRADSAQWRIWQVAEQFFTDSGAGSRARAIGE
ncbi:MAG: hypothetical protein HKN58_08915 [Xanthomonadales bacterium]|nr:hypothetical protein [Xanthomonadales bacterium]